MSAEPTLASNLACCTAEGAMGQSPGCDGKWTLPTEAGFCPETK